MEEEFFVDNRTIKKNIMPAYQKVINVMKKKLNHAEKYNEIDLKPRESRIMFEILRFHPDFEIKWTKGCKFVYATDTAEDGKTYSDIFIKPPNGKLVTFSKKDIKQHLKKDANSKIKLDLEDKFNMFMKTKPDLGPLRREINNRKKLGLCTKIFGKKTEVSLKFDINEFIFCDYCLVRTDFNKYKCSNPLENHDTIDKILRKPRYSPGIAATIVDEDDNAYSRYYKVIQDFRTEKQHEIKNNSVIYILGDKTFNLVGKYSKNNKSLINNFRKNMDKAEKYTLPDDIKQKSENYFEKLVK